MDKNPIPILFSSVKKSDKNYIGGQVATLEQEENGIPTLQEVSHLFVMLSPYNPFGVCLRTFLANE